jgi:hypothetical protein
LSFKGSNIAPGDPNFMRNDRAPSEDEELVTAVEGPHGTAEVYEICRQTASGELRYEYEVRFKGIAETFVTLGEASTVAGERCGVKH